MIRLTTIISKTNIRQYKPQAWISACCIAGEQALLMMIMMMVQHTDTSVLIAE
jgi:hypothetical protein